MSNSKSESLEKLRADISEIINKEIKENTALLRINVGTHGGTLIASEFRTEGKLTEEKIASATSSLLFLSSKMLSGSLNQEISYNLIAGKDIYLLSILTEYITMVCYLNRELAELEGLLQQYINPLKDLALRISAIFETSDVIREEIFIAIKRAIPNALILAIISRDGLPIQIQSTMAEPMLSAMSSAIYSLSEVLLEGSLEYSIISGEMGSIILHELDERRILCVAVPEAEETKLGSYIAKIKKIISKST
jgi:predicted regulator of Ras-like GTPase activity (Roadblock/LC7/MglB family)